MSAAARVHRVRVPFRAPLRTAGGTWTARESWLLRLEEPGGRAGWGEAALEDDDDTAVLGALLADLVATGLPPARALVDRAGRAGLAFRAALDGARLDLLAQRPEAVAAGLPVVGVNATIGAGETGTVVEESARAVAGGFRTLKLKAAPGDTTATLVERVGAVRAAVGDDIALRLDVNGTWDLEAAAERLRAMAGFGIQYVEQPLAPDALAGAVTLRSRSGIPVAADEAVGSVAAAIRLLEAHAADVLVVKPGRVGGPVAVAEIALLAADRGVPVVISSLFETGVGLAAALACAGALPDVPGWPAAERDHGLATAGLLEHDLLRRPLRVQAGRMRAPGGAGSGGYGVSVDAAAVERYRVGES